MDSSCVQCCFLLRGAPAASGCWPALVWQLAGLSQARARHECGSSQDHHVHQKAEAERTEEEEVGYHPPDLHRPQRSVVRGRVGQVISIARGALRCRRNLLET